MGTPGLSPEDVLRLRFIRDAQVAPGGDVCAYVLSYTEAAGRDLSSVWILDLASGSERELAIDATANHPRWSRDGSHLAYVACRDGSDSLVAVRLADDAVRQVDFPGARVRGAPAWSPDGRRIALVLEPQVPATSAVRRVNSRHFRADGLGYIESLEQRICTVDLSSGGIDTLVDRVGFYSHLDWDPATDQILFLATTSPIPGAGYSPRLYSVCASDRSIREYLGDGWFIVSARWSLGGRGIIVVGAYQSAVTVPTTDLWEIDFETGSVTCRSTPVKGRVGFRIHHDMPIWEIGQLWGVAVKDAGTALVTVQSGGCAEIYEMSLNGPVRCKRITGGERSCIVLNACATGQKLLFLGTDMLNPPDLFLLDGETERCITRLNGALQKGWPAIRRRPLQVRSADGLEVEGWFLSLGQSCALPTVLFIHGGPFMAVGHAFRFDFHMLASHGFGVLFANFRGSFGYGEGFARGIMNDWGARGFPDHMAAVDCAAALGWTDPLRVGVWGASHGGFATCWLIGHTRRFRAAVAEAAVTDLTTAYYLSDAPELFVRDLGGRPHEIPDVYRSRSPLTYAHRCRTPTLLLHGEQDLRCPISEAEQFHRALLDAGCTSEMVRLRDANHMGDSIGPPAARVGQNEALLQWFERFL